MRTMSTAPEGMVYTVDPDRHEGKTLRMIVNHEKRVAIESAVRRNGCLARAARELGISTSGLHKIIRRLEIPCELDGWRVRHTHD